MDISKDNRFPSLEIIAQMNVFYPWIRSIEGITKFQVLFNEAHVDDEKNKSVVSMNFVIELGDNKPVFKNDYIIDLEGDVEYQINSQYLSFIKNILERLIINI